MSHSRKIFFSPIICNYLTHSAREKLVINKELSGVVLAAGLSGFDEIWNYPETEIIKKKDNRSVGRIDLNCSGPFLKKPYPAHNGQAPFFIKKHSESLNLCQRAGLIEPPGEGLREFYNYCDLRKKGLATALPVAGGMKRNSSTIKSFIVTMDFSPLYPLEEVIINQPERLISRDNRKKRRRILKSIAGYARRMHRQGVNQKDFNATHLLLDDSDSPEPIIALFDLQHIDRRKISSFRWPVKALAELNVSLPRSIFSEEDRFFLFYSYKGKIRLSFFDRIQYTWMVRKTARIQRHVLKNNLAPKYNRPAYSPDKR
ncbi:MAG: lipopolysaccharide kinase InaA family protein [Thermodesulfobacteriota bacterium]